VLRRVSLGGMEKPIVSCFLAQTPGQQPPPLHIFQSFNPPRPPPLPFPPQLVEADQLSSEEGAIRLSWH